MRLNGKAVSWGAALLLASWAAPASAVTRCVNPAGGSCYTTIQAAVNAAGPADVITIATGTYLETINIPAGKDGLQLKGVGAVTVDNEVGTGAVADVITVGSNNVSLANLMVRNGRARGVVVGPAATGFQMTGMKVTGPEGDCVYFNGGTDGAKISGSTFRACSDGIHFPNTTNNLTITGNTISLVVDAINGTGNNAVITKNKIFTTENYGIYVYTGSSPNISTNTLTGIYTTGIYVNNLNNATVSGNVLTATESTGIYVYGDTPVITSNTIVSAYSNGIEVYGANAMVKSNVIKGTDATGIYLSSGPTTSDNPTVTLNKIVTYPGGDGMDIYAKNAVVTSNSVSNASQGIYVSGDNPKIASNLLTNLQGTGIYSNCPNPCSGGLIQSNKLTDLNNGNDGIDVYAPGAVGTTTVSMNNVTRAESDCYYLNGVLVTAATNKGYDCGAYNQGYGFEVYGTNLTLTSNQIYRSAADGFFIASTSTALSGNLSDHATQDGFDIHANSVTLTSNKATANTGSGFEVNGGQTAVILTTNNATGNGIDLCDAGAGTVKTGNTFGTTAATPGTCALGEGFIGN